MQVPVSHLSVTCRSMFELCNMITDHFYVTEILLLVKPQNKQKQIENDFKL